MENAFCTTVLCERNPTWSVDSLHKGPIVPGSNVAFVVCLNKLFNKRWYCQWCHRAHVTPCTVMMFLFSFCFRPPCFVSIAHPPFTRRRDWAWTSPIARPTHVSKGHAYIQRGLVMIPSILSKTHIQWDPRSSPVRANYGGLFKIWSMFYLRGCCVLCNIVL